jgi:hypothetical protein
MSQCIHFNLDGAWPTDAMGIDALDLREWGPKLRFITRESIIEQFYEYVRPSLRPFVLLGSGDFHHLAGVLLRRIEKPVVVISFDNHPDWDIRPPRWSCGGWINRALELSSVQRVCVWGCGNFELNFPSRLFGNRRALHTKRLELHPWGERFTGSARRQFECMSREDWRGRFERFCNELAGAAVYATVDLDCLAAGESATNWEQGLFTAGDVAWALRLLQQHTTIAGGDVCGAYSAPNYARPFQRFAARWDHPEVPISDSAEAQAVNLRALATIWPDLTEKCDA